MTQLTIWEDDLPEEVIERLSGILCEFGIYIRHVGTGRDGEFITNNYEFDLAEPLPEEEMIS